MGPVQPSPPTSEAVKSSNSHSVRKRLSTVRDRRTFFKILFDFDAESPDELSVREGEVVSEVRNDEEAEQEGWVQVENSAGKVGFVPVEYAGRG